MIRAKKNENKEGSKTPRGSSVNCCDLHLSDNEFREVAVLFGRESRESSQISTGLEDGDRLRVRTVLEGGRPGAPPRNLSLNKGIMDFSKWGSGQVKLADLTSDMERMGTMSQEEYGSFVERLNYMTEEDKHKFMTMQDPLFFNRMKARILLPFANQALASPEHNTVARALHAARSRFC